MWKTLEQEDGTVWAVSLMGQGFEPSMVFTTAFLECPRYQFLKIGDGLITVCALEGVATYGIVGDATDHHVPAVRANLLQVKPGLVDQVLDQFEDDG